MEYNKDKVDLIIASGKPISYKKLCSEIEIPYKTSDSKQAQLKALNNVYKIDKIGTKYLFIRHLTREEMIEENKKVQFQEIVECSLSHVLSKQEGYCKTFTSQELLVLCCMLSKDYNVCRYNPYLAYNEIELPIDEDGTPCKMQTFNSTTKYIGLSMKAYLSGALRSLNNKSIISLKHTHRTYTTHPKYEHKENVKDVEIGSKTDALILDCKRAVWGILGYETLEDMKSDYKKEVDSGDLTKKEYDNFFNVVLYEKYNEEIYKRSNKEYHGFYECYHITYSNASLIDNIESIKKKGNDESIAKILSLKSFQTTEKHQEGLMKIMIDATVNINRPYKLHEAQKEEYRRIKEKMINE